MASHDPVAAECLRQANRLEQRASAANCEDDMRAAALLRVFYGMCQADSINRKVLVSTQR
jgi:hypothetical protein